jgi:hypothetical protein
MSPPQVRGGGSGAVGRSPGSGGTARGRARNAVADHAERPHRGPAHIYTAGRKGPPSWRRRPRILGLDGASPSHGDDVTLPLRAAV